ncbi:MAG: hypothetical protein LBO65_10970 [Spirochaetaceae bacterium]|jgi:hypothetical protein|nr:hypothetical protein [Spirochaetaceae bacterium]
MDEQRRAIRELEEKSREALLFKTRTLEDTGKALAERLEGASLPGDQGSFYRRFKQEIADSEASVESIQGSLRRIKELDEEITIKRIEKADREEEASPLYTALGRHVLDEQFTRTVPAELYLYKRQRTLFLDRAASLEQRLLDLENPGGGIFSRFTGAIRRGIFRRGLKKIEGQLDRVHCQGGRLYAGILETNPGAGEQSGDAPADSDFAVLLRDVRAKRQLIAELDDAIGVLEEEKNKIRGAFYFKEKPKRHIKMLKERTKKRQRDLLELYRRIGEAAGSDPALQQYLGDQERLALEKVLRYDKEIEENHREIERIETAMAIDKERKKITRFERAVDGEKKRALSSEKNITELNRKIAEVHKKIGELSEE